MEGDDNDMDWACGMYGTEEKFMQCGETWTEETTWNKLGV
jgi:hypothetical protein